MSQEVDVKQYFVGVFVKGGKKGDHLIQMDARKFAIKNSIGSTNGVYRFDLEQIRIEMGEEMAMEFWEMLMYLLPEERVKKAVKEYVERCF